jgi:hypothetical protein
MTTMMTMMTRTATTDGDATVVDALRLEALVSDLCARGYCQRKFFLFLFNLSHSPTLTRFPSQSAWPDTSESSRPDITIDSFSMIQTT